MSQDVPAFPKPARLKSRPYLGGVRRRPCLIDHVTAEAHHTTSIGARGWDFRAVPLCHRHHRELHRLGRTTFEDKHRVDIVEEILRLLETYGSSRGDQ